MGNKKIPMYNLVLVKTHKAIYTKTIWISTKMLVVLFCVIIHFNKTFQVYPWILYINNSIFVFYVFLHMSL